MLKQIFRSSLNPIMSKDSVRAKCVFIYVCLLSLTDFLLYKFQKAISSTRKGLFSLFLWFPLLKCLCVSLHVFLFTKALLSREEIFHHFRKRKLSPRVEVELKNLAWVLGMAGKGLLRFQSLNFSDIRVNLMHSHHKLLEATLTSCLFVCFIFLKHLLALDKLPAVGISKITPDICNTDESWAKA